MALTEAQKQYLNRPNVTAAAIVQMIDNGQVQLNDVKDALSDAGKVSEITSLLAARPNSAEVREWQAIEPQIGSPGAYNVLAAYIGHWSSIMPNGNHVEFAREEMRRIENADWDSVNLMDIHSLENYLMRYPQSVHMSEIDDAVWSLMSASPIRLENIQHYMDNFSAGRHLSEADGIIKAYNQWIPISDSSDVFEIKRYINDFPQSPFLPEAIKKLNQLKSYELSEMKSNPAKYDRGLLFDLINGGIITEAELYRENLMTQNAMNTLLNINTIQGALVPVNDMLDRCAINRTDCREGSTDVFLFGIPSTGKTCVLMGLIGSSMIINFAAAAGPYAEELYKWRQAGLTPGSTNNTMAAAMQADIEDRDTNATHSINLIEMSGEDFAFKLAQAPDGNMDINDLGGDLAQMLSNNNPKIIFIVVDPTVSSIVGKHTITSTRIVENEDGTSYSVVDERIEPYFLSQEVTLLKMLSILGDDSNSNIMKNVMGVHFIVTKADMLGDSEADRNNRAREIFQKDYPNVVASVVKLFKKYRNINLATNGIPKLYTFSLGKFFPGGIYEYKPIDSNKLVDAIRLNSLGEKEENAWERFKKSMN